jgi:hypothetical protein
MSGLLTDVGGGAENGDAFSRSMKLCPGLIREPGVLWAALKKDIADGQDAASYLRDKRQKMSDYFQTNTVTDREEFRTNVVEAITANEVYPLTIFIGGRSIGKTQVLKTVVEKEYPNHLVVFVNGRSDKLASGIEKGLKEYDNKSLFANIEWEKILASVSSCFGASATTAAVLGEPNTVAFTKAESLSTGAASQLVSAMKSINDAQLDDTATRLIDLMGKLAEQTGRRPVLIVDEANLALSTTDTVSLVLLGKLCQVSKEVGNFNVILCSSVHSYPIQLRRGGLNLQDCMVFQVPELSPKAAYKFLRFETNDGDTPIVGLGHNFAECLLQCFGGNLFLMYNVTKKILKDQDKVKVFETIENLEGADQILPLLAAETSQANRYSVMLKQLGEKGYCTVSQGDKALADTLVEKGISSIVHPEQCLDNELRQQLVDVEFPMYALVPSSIALRHLILMALRNEIKVAEVRNEIGYAEELGAYKAASDMYKQAKVMEDNGAPVDVVEHIRKRAAALMSAHMSNGPDTPAIEYKKVSITKSLI